MDLKSMGRTYNWEEHLVRRAQSGDAVAAELLIDLYRQSVRAHARRLLRDPDDAEDVVQETFVKGFKALGSFDASRPLLPWLLRICTNCSVDAVRLRKRACSSIDQRDQELPDTQVDVEKGVESRQDNEQVQRAIERLPDRYREIIELRHYQHMEVNEIANLLNRPEGTVKSWLFRARALLKKDLQVVMG